MSNPAIPAALARALLAGPQTTAELTTRALRTLGRSWAWLPALVQRYQKAFPGPVRPRLQEVTEFLLRDDRFRAIRRRHGRKLRVASWINEPPVMQPVPSAKRWSLPPIETPERLAAWLDLTPGELDWFADLKLLCHAAPDTPLQHYRYRVLIKQSGGLRLIEAPKLRLKQIQKLILTGILDLISLHPSVHGFRKARSIRTFTAPHVGQPLVLRMDLQDYFGSISRFRVQSLFRTLGYPEAVAALLGGLCTTAAPRAVFDAAPAGTDRRTVRQARDCYARPHLPQGAPTSPALANLCSYRFDCRLHGLAQSMLAEYTRYADDLAFSGGGPFAESADRFAAQVAAILSEEGFAVHHRKTRAMRQSVRQHLAGLVTNQGVNVIREDFDTLKAILTNCIRTGPASQNRSNHPAFRSHLEGRIGFIATINPAKAAKLRTLFDRISWT